MRKHVQATARDLCNMLHVATKVGRQRFHQEFRRRLLQKCDRLGKMLAALVRQVVAVHTSQDDVVQAPALHGKKKKK